MLNEKAFKDAKKMVDFMSYKRIFQSKKASNRIDVSQKDRLVFQFPSIIFQSGTYFPVEILGCYVFGSWKMGETLSTPSFRFGLFVSGRVAFPESKNTEPKNWWFSSLADVLLFQVVFSRGPP